MAPRVERAKDAIGVETLSEQGAVQAVGLAIGKWAGVLVSLILAWVFLTATVVYNYAFARLLFVSGLEKRLPHQKIHLLRRSHLLKIHLPHQRNHRQKNHRWE